MTLPDISPPRSEPGEQRFPAGPVAAPRWGAGMAINGLFLFLGASLGPIRVQSGLAFASLLIILMSLLVAVAERVTSSNHIIHSHTGGVA